MIKLSVANQYTLNSMPRGKDNTVPIAYSCNVTNKVVVVDLNSGCYLCPCDGWLPVSVGQVGDFTSLEEILNSPIAKEIQQDIADKKFTYCAVEHCGVKTRNIIQDKYELAINLDESCNLYCPSCRREQIMHTDGPVYEAKLKDLYTILSWLEKFEHPIHITLSGNGDPLASRIIRPLIKTLRPKKNQTFTLFTNGLLIKKHLANSPIRNNITSIRISVDAGSEEVYENVRRGGSWKVLMENFNFIKENGYAHLISLRYAVQNNNYKDLFKFVEMCDVYKFRAHIHQLDDWATWSKTPTDIWTIKNGTFNDNNVLNNAHTNYEACRTIVEEIRNKKNSRIEFSTRLLQLLNYE